MSIYGSYSDKIGILPLDWLES